MATTPAPKELHICAGLNACYQHGKSGTNECAGTGDCATIVNDSCHGNNECRGQGGCGGGGSLGSQQYVPGENLCRGKGSCRVPDGGIVALRQMSAASESGQPITGIYEGRHVWQVARLLFEQRMMASGRTFTNDPANLGPKKSADSNSAADHEYAFFGLPPADKALGPNTTPDIVADRPIYSYQLQKKIAVAKKTAFGKTTKS